MFQHGCPPALTLLTKEKKTLESSDDTITGFAGILEKEAAVVIEINTQN